MYAALGLSLFPLVSKEGESHTGSTKLSQKGLVLGGTGGEALPGKVHRLVH